MVFRAIQSLVNYVKRENSMVSAPSYYRHVPGPLRICSADLASSGSRQDISTAKSRANQLTSSFELRLVQWLTIVLVNLIPRAPTYYQYPGKGVIYGRRYLRGSEAPVRDAVNINLG